jgi:hypothetical protein
MPWARIGELVGHDDVVTTARTYTGSFRTRRRSTTRSFSVFEEIPTLDDVALR